MTDSDFFADSEKVSAVARYRAHPGFNQSTAWQLLSKSPRHAWDYRNRVRGGVDKDHSRDREIGVVAHALILGATSQIVEIQADDYRDKAAQKRRTEAEIAGETPILTSDLAKARRAANAAREQLGAFGVEINDGLSEVELYWSEDGQPCKALLDNIGTWNGRPCVIDVKSGTDANPHGLLRRIVASGYHVQGGCYTRAYEAVYGERVPFLDVFVETSGLALVTPCEIGGELLSIGEKQWLRAVSTWKECTESGVWPGYADSVVAMHDAPMWLVNAEFPSDIGGEEEAAE